MGQKDTVILIVATFAAIFLMCAAFVLILLLYRRRRKQHEQEKIYAEQLYQQQLLSSQLQTQQQTMQHIGTEIHDNVGQKLTLASLYSKQITPQSVNLQEKINAVGKIIDESLADLRQLSKSLTNPALASADINELLAEDAKRINASGACYVSVVCTPAQIILPQDKKNVLYRLLQEFMQNSLKHAGCRKIAVCLAKQGNLLHVTITDDGKGFDTVIVSKGLGLQNMKRRAAQLGADFNLTSKEGEGTQLSLQIQL